MSVAFRRESDDEHKEPTFELPIPPGPNLVTARGLALIQAQVAHLEDQPATADEDAKKAAARDLRYWRQRLATARLTPPPPRDLVGFGSRVRIRLNGDERTIHIVGEDEAVPAEGLIGLLAPLARAMIDAEVGERLPFAGREDAIQVLEILSAD